MPPQFKDFGKSAKDVLSKNYTSEQKLSISSKVTDASFDTEWTSRGKAKLDTEFSLPQKNTLNLETTQDGKITATLKAKNLLPSCTIKAKTSTATNLFLGLEYGPDFGSFSTDAEYDFAKDTSVLNMSGLISQSSFHLGGSVKVLPQGFGLSEYTVGAGYCEKAFEVTAKLSENIEKGSSRQLLLQYVHHVNPLTSYAASFSQALDKNNQTTCEIGGTHKLTPDTTVGLKIDNTARIGMYAMMSVNKNVTLTHSVQLKEISGPHNYGITLKLKH